MKVWEGWAGAFESCGRRKIVMVEAKTHKDACAILEQEGCDVEDPSMVRPVILIPGNLEHYQISEADWAKDEIADTNPRGG